MTARTGVIVKLITVYSRQKWKSLKHLCQHSLLNTLQQTAPVPCPIFSAIEKMQNESDCRYVNVSFVFMTKSNFQHTKKSQGKCIHNNIATGAVTVVGSLMTSSCFIFLCTIVLCREIQASVGVGVIGPSGLLP